MTPRQILTSWKSLLDRFAEGTLVEGLKDGRDSEVCVEWELLRLGEVLYEILPADEEYWEKPAPLFRLFGDTMWFIEHHLVRTEYSGEPYALATGEKLESGMLILSVLQEIACDLFHAGTQGAE